MDEDKEREHIRSEIANILRMADVTADTASRVILQVTRSIRVDYLIMLGVACAISAAIATLICLALF